MKVPFGTLFLLLGLFVVSPNMAFACGNGNACHGTDTRQESCKKSCCAQKQVLSACARDSKGQKTSPSCPCGNENGGCSCPGCGMICHSGAAFPVETPFLPSIPLEATSLQKQAFYFADHLPEAVYLPIWQPPKIAA